MLLFDQAGLCLYLLCYGEILIQMWRIEYPRMSHAPMHWLNICPTHRHKHSVPTVLNITFLNY